MANVWSRHTIMAQNITRLAKSGSDCADNDLEAYDIIVREQDAVQFFQFEAGSPRLRSQAWAISCICVSHPEDGISGNPVSFIYQ